MNVDYRTGEITEPTLTAMERSALTHAEAKIERGLSSFLEVGAALMDVRESRLYREEFPTFEAYCTERWGITDRRARQMIDATTVTTSLPTGTIVPVTESQARELAGLDPEDAAEVMETAAEIADGKITAATIREAREVAFPSPAPEVAPTPPAPAVPRATAPTLASVPAPPMVDEAEWNEQDRAEELAGNLARNLSLLYAVTNPERRAEYIATWRRGIRSRPVLGQNFITPTHMRRLADALHDFATEWENADV